MIFDNLLSIFKNLTDENIFELIISPNLRYFLSLSIDSIGIWNFDLQNFPLKLKYILNENEKNQFGIFKNICWINLNQFSILTTFGFVLFFEIKNNIEIILNFYKFSNINSFFLSLTTFFNYVIIGDNLGYLSIISPNHPDIIIKKLTDFSIKKIQINGKNGIFLSGSSLLYIFKIDNDIFYNENFQFHIKNIENGPFLSFSISPNGEYFSTLSINGKVYLNNFNGNNILINIFHSSLSSIYWSYNSLNLIITSNENFLIIYSLITKNYKSFKNFNIPIINSLLLSKQFLIISSNNGLYYYPIIQIANGKSPLLYTNDIIFEIRSSMKKGIIIKHFLPLNDLNNIEYICGDDYEHFIALSNSKKLGLLDRSTNKFYFPNHEKFNIKGIFWFKTFLCLLFFYV